MDMKTGKIELITIGETVKHGHIELSPVEAKFIEQYPEEVRTFELLWLRAWKSMGWDFMKRLKNREAFRQGWNAAVFAKADAYMVLEKDIPRDEKA